VAIFNCKDDPATAVLLVVYLALGITHAVMFFKISKRTFIPQAMVMGFCFSRVVTMSLRLAWSNNVTNKNVAIAATVFLNAGVLLIVLSPLEPSLTFKYVVNLIFVHRYILQLFRSIPTRGGHPFNFAAHTYMLSAVPVLVLLIVPAVQSFLTSSPSQISTDRTILRFAQCYLMVFVAVQFLATIVAWLIHFFSSKKTSGISAKEATVRAAIILSVGALLIWIQAVKLCQTFYTVGPQTAQSPPWFLRRPALYSGLFLPELLCIIIYAVSGIRLRFLKPNREAKEEGAESPSDEITNPSQSADGEKRHESLTV
jgi:hypothetical protein